MKKLLSLALVLLLGVAALASCGEDVTLPSGMQLASTEICDYYFFVPSNWTLNTQTGFVSAYVSASDASNVSMTSYGIDGEGKTVGEYIGDALAELGSYAEVGAIAMSDTFLDGVAAKQIEYNTVIAGADYRILQVYCVKNSTVYLFTFTATPEKFEEHIDKIGVILADFRFMDGE